MDFESAVYPGGVTPGLMEVQFRISVAELRAAGDGGAAFWAEGAGGAGLVARRS